MEDLALAGLMEEKLSPQKYVFTFSCSSLVSRTFTCVSSVTRAYHPVHACLIYRDEPKDAEKIILKFD